MYRNLAILLGVLLTSHSYAHQFTPTYPTYQSSGVEGIYKLELKLFNKREDIRFYGISVYDKDWNKIPFAMTSEKVILVEYLQEVEIDVYVRHSDSDRALYVCSESKIIKGDREQVPLVSSKVCSKIK